MKVRIFAVLIIAALAATVHTYGANAATASSSATSRTCAAVKIWESHATAANLAAVSADAKHVTGWLRSDVKQLVSDVQAGETKYVPGDERYLSQDCGNLAVSAPTHASRAVYNRCVAAIANHVQAVAGGNGTDNQPVAGLVKAMCGHDHLSARQFKRAEFQAGRFESLTNS